MTMPGERTRSLRWAHELLGALSMEGELPTEIRDRACAISSAFPSPQTIQSLIASNAERLPTDLAIAIEAARALLVDLQASGYAPAPMQQDILYTLRHFPPAGAAKGFARGRFAFGIESWLGRDNGEL